jgi:hypothetical protein
VNEHWSLALSYRELHNWLGAQVGPSFSDDQRFATAQLRGLL